MPKCLRVLTTATFAALFSVAAFTNPTRTDLPADLAERVRAYDVAQVEGDKAALEDLLADDFVLVNSRGKRETKAQFIADMTKAGFRIEPFVVEEPVELVWSDGAVMAGVARLRGMDEGQTFDVRLRFSDIWAKRGGKWRVIYTHASREPSK